MYPTISIPKLHTEYSTWMTELNFCKEEIKIFEHQLEKLVITNDDYTFKAQIEHFQNQFIREKEVIDILKHKLNVSEKQLANFVKDLSDSWLENVRMDNHTKLRDDVLTFRNIFKELKEEFRRFEADCMLGVYA